MKKGIKLLLATFLIFPVIVYAKGSVSISAPSTVEVGNTFTVNVSLKDMNGWDVEINSSGSTSGCSSHEVGDLGSDKNGSKNLSVKCKATSTGSIGITVTGTLSDADSNENDVSASKRITVTPVREKSNDATLSSLSLEGYELTPKFSKDKLEYSVTVPSTVNSVKLNAKVSESHASLTGTGEVEVSEGLNVLEVVVTAETGAKKTYVVNVNVEDINPIEVKVGNGNYTIIKNAKNLVKPELYEETTVDINGFAIPAFYSEITNFTLVGVKDESGTIQLVIYNTENNEYHIYNEFNSSSTTLYLVDFPEELKGYNKSTIAINEVEVPIYKYKDDSRFVICYGMNVETGKYDYYSYDTKEGTFQIWNKEEIEALQKDVNTYLYVCIAFGVGLVVAFVLILVLLHKKKVKKIDKKQEEKKKSFAKEELKLPFEKELEQEKTNKLEKFDRFDNKDEEKK